MAAQKPVSVDPVAMQDLGGYGMVAQVFEFLATLGENGEIAPGLAESWEPNEDGSVWTFKLRQGVKWQDGTDFTSDDVAATMDRLVEAGKAGLKGVIEKGAVDASDPATAVFTLTSPNGNFPYLVSVFNAQTVITPVDYVTGTTLDKNSNGTGPLEADASTTRPPAPSSRATTPGGAARRHWTATEFQFFDDLGTMVTAMQGGSVDAIVQFSVIGGDALLNSPDFNLLEVESSTHRQIWMRCDKGQFAEKEVRQALALHLRPPADARHAVQGPGRASATTTPSPRSCPSTTARCPSARRTSTRPSSSCPTPASPASSATLHAVDLQEIPELAAAHPERRQGGRASTWRSRWRAARPSTAPSGARPIRPTRRAPVPPSWASSTTATGWCLTCSSTPRLATKGVWNSSQYSSPEFDAAFKEYQGAIGVDAQKAACKKIETILNEDVPVGVPFFYNYLSGNSKKFQGVRVSALGQMFLDKASQV